MLSYSKAEEWFLKTWKDSVWSKVIAASIIGIFGTWSYCAFNGFKAFVRCILLLELPIYIFILIAMAIYLVKLAIQKLLREEIAGALPYDINQEIVGDYTFGQLVNILSNTTIAENTYMMEHNDMDFSKVDVLTLFNEFYSYLNKGVSNSSVFDECGLLWGILAPKLVDYKLMKIVEQVIYTEKEVPPTFIVSEEGAKFY